MQKFDPNMTDILTPKQTTGKTFDFESQKYSAFSEPNSPSNSKVRKRILVIKRNSQVNNKNGMSRQEVIDKFMKY
jgi:hypothetical protein